MHRVVIIGGGFGGLYAARTLRGAPVQVTLIDRRNFHLFQPLLYQVATAALSPANIASPLRYILKRHSNARVLLAEAVDFDLAGRRVILKDGDIAYDSLIVAPGAENNYFGHPDWAPYAPALKTLEDATEIRRRILLAFESAEREPDAEKRRAWLTFVVVGAGPTGVELAGSLGEIARDTLRHEFRSIESDSARILLVDFADRVLGTYPGDLSGKAQEALSQLGVEFLSDRFVTGITLDHIRVRRQNQEETIPTRTVLWAAGVKGAALGQALARAAGLVPDKAGRVEVQPDLSIPGHPEVRVIGDLALCRDASGKALPGTAPVAIQEGRYAAEAIAASLKGKTLEAFRYNHRGDMATIGRAAAVANFGRFRFSGPLAWLAWLFVHLLYIVEFEDRLLVFTQWAWSYLTRNRSARLITGENPQTKL